MRANLKLVRCWQVEIGGVAIGTFTEVARWEGIAKLEDAQGRVILVDDPNTQAGLMSELFDGSFSVDVIKHSQGLVLPPQGEITRA